MSAGTLVAIIAPIIGVFGTGAGGVLAVCLTWLRADKDLLAVDQRRLLRPARPGGVPVASAPTVYCGAGWCSLSSAAGICCGSCSDDGCRRPRRVAIAVTAATMAQPARMSMT